jgi:hypothetical protein
MLVQEFFKIRESSCWCIPQHWGNAPVHLMQLVQEYFKIRESRGWSIPQTLE